MSAMFRKFNMQICQKFLSIIVNSIIDRYICHRSCERHPHFIPRPFSVFRHLPQVEGGCDPPGVWKLSVEELSGKHQRIALDKYSRLVVRFLILGQKLTPSWGVKSQIFAKSAIFQIYIIIFRKLLIVGTYGFHQRVPRLIINNIACRYRFWMEYM